MFVLNFEEKPRIHISVCARMDRSCRQVDGIEFLLVSDDDDDGTVVPVDREKVHTVFQPVLTPGSDARSTYLRVRPFPKPFKIVHQEPLVVLYPFAEAGVAGVVDHMVAKRGKLPGTLDVDISATYTKSCGEKPLHLHACVTTPPKFVMSLMQAMPERACLKRNKRREGFKKKIR